MRREVFDSLGKYGIYYIPRRRVVHREGHVLVMSPPRLKDERRFCSGMWYLLP